MSNKLYQCRNTDFPIFKINQRKNNFQIVFDVFSLMYNLLTSVLSTIKQPLVTFTCHSKLSKTNCSVCSNLFLSDERMVIPHNLVVIRYPATTKY